MILTPPVLHGREPVFLLEIGDKAGGAGEGQKVRHGFYGNIREIQDPFGILQFAQPDVAHGPHTGFANEEIRNIMRRTMTHAGKIFQRDFVMHVTLDVFTAYPCDGAHVAEAVSCHGLGKIIRRVGGEQPQLCKVIQLRAIADVTVA